MIALITTIVLFTFAVITALEARDSLRKMQGNILGRSDWAYLCGALQWGFISLVCVVVALFYATKI